jgi:UDP-glucose 4-epimerase
MQSWLVTGGCGFIGSHLVDALLMRGDRVRVLDDLSTGKTDRISASVELLIGDVCDRELMAQAIDGVDGVFHLAAIASVERCKQDWVGCHRTNLTGTITVLDAARQIDSRPPLPVVYASSAAVYGDNPHLPLSESAETRPLSAYGADKLGTELHGHVAWSVHGVANVGLRFFNVYGPRQDPLSPYSGVIAKFAERLAQDAPIEIFGDGQQTRDFIFISDVVAHVLLAMDGLRSGARVFNVCTGRATSILELARTMAEIAGRRAKICHRPARVDDIKASVGDPGAARSALGLEASMKIAEGLRTTMQFINLNLQR